MGEARRLGLVFVSAKSDDAEHARRVYEFLRKNDIPAFWSGESLHRLGKADYRNAIDEQLDAAEHMVVVASSGEHARSKWVEAEWGTFVNELRSGRKSGNVVTMTVGNLKVAALPVALRSYEVISLDDASLDRLLSYVEPSAAVAASSEPSESPRLGRRKTLGIALAAAVTACFVAVVAFKHFGEDTRAAHLAVNGADEPASLTDLRQWDAATSAQRKLSAEAVARREEDFALLKLETFTAGGQTHEMAIYSHAETGLEFALVPAGKFQMGSPLDEAGRETDETEHTVTLTKPFLICRTECTQSAYQKVVKGTNPAHFKGATRPVESVAWDKAVTFCQYSGLALPTEAQWEYACRAGTTARFCCGDSAANLAEFGSCGENATLATSATHAVREKKPNAFGLFDVHGNVGEWCGDWYGDYPTLPTTDPEGPSVSQYRVIRGGGWCFSVVNSRAAFRYKNLPSLTFSAVGFRPIRIVAP